MSHKIMICDDEEGVRESLKLILGEHYDLVVVESGQQALHTLSHDKNIGLIFMDIKMPKVNGLDTLTEIKSKHPKAKIVMVTGYRSVEAAAEASRLGACGYIVKPFKSEEILDAAKKHLG